ncbi:hypothetical protein ES705_38848 [subsurface metagenome]
MSWLYEHRHQLDGLELLVEIAHWAVIEHHLPPDDRDDVEQEIVIRLMQTVEKYGNKGKNYLWAVARNQICSYFNGKYKEKRLCYIQATDSGEKANGSLLGNHDRDIVARLDAMAILVTLPERLIQIGHKILNGEKLREADQHYWINQKRRLRPKLNCRRYANRLSDWEKRRILHLHREGVPMCKIARTMKRTNSAVMRVLAGHQPLSRRGWLAKMEMAAKERDERIRHAYFVDGKGTHQIAREFHYGDHTVHKAIKSAGII